MPKQKQEKNGHHGSPELAKTIAEIGSRVGELETATRNRTLELAKGIGELSSQLATLAQRLDDLDVAAAAPAADTGIPADLGHALKVETDKFLREELGGKTLPEFLEQKIRQLYARVGLQVADELGEANLRALMRDIANDAIAEYRRTNPLAR